MSFVEFMIWKCLLLFVSDWIFRFWTGPDCKAWGVISLSGSTLVPFVPFQGQTSRIQPQDKSNCAHLRQRGKTNSQNECLFRPVASWHPPCADSSLSLAADANVQRIQTLTLKSEMTCTSWFNLSTNQELFSTLPILCHFILRLHWDDLCYSLD